MKALITGASSGIGRDMARALSRRGVDLILVARRTDRLEALKSQLPATAEVIGCDLSKAENCIALYDRVKDSGVDILVNNAGFGLYGRFTETELDTELQLIDTNIRATHILTKLFLKDFVRRDRGYLLNVASSAGFLPGPRMAAYYASKSYVLRLTEAVYEELRRSGSRVCVSVLCPGPVRTEFSDVADVRFTVGSLDSQAVADYAVRKLFQRKLVIIPGATMKAARLLEHFVDEKTLLRCVWYMQHER